MPVVLGIIIFLLVVGSLIAIAWWNLSARAAPYADENAKRKARRQRELEEEAANTVLLGEDGRPLPRTPAVDHSARNLGLAAGMMGAAHASAHTHAPNPATTPVERDDPPTPTLPATTESSGTLYAGPDADTTGFGGGGSSYGGGFSDGGGMDSGSSGSDSSIA